MDFRRLGERRLANYLWQIVIPRLKKAGSNPDSPENYRPISNLNNISKILERLFLARIQQHITTCANFNQF